MSVKRHVFTSGAARQKRKPVGTFLQAPMQGCRPLHAALPWIPLARQFPLLVGGSSIDAAAAHHYSRKCVIISLQPAVSHLIVLFFFHKKSVNDIFYNRRTQTWKLERQPTRQVRSIYSIPSIHPSGGVRASKRVQCKLSAGAAGAEAPRSNADDAVRARCR